MVMKHWDPELSTAEQAAWRRRTICCALVLLLTTLWAARITARPLALYLVQTEDVPVLFIASAAILLTMFWSPRWRLPELPSTRVLLAAGIVLATLLTWGTYALMGNFPLSRDEHMVVFDMAVFNSGRLAVPIAPEWRPFALALVPNFLLNANHPVGFVSAYTPVNAMLRAAFSKIADPAWYNPLLVIAGGAALLDIARRTFGKSDRACLVVLLVYSLSAQVLANAMTTYSMTGHLAFNLIWLAAFLRGGKIGNSVALVTGFLAVGLHQVAFHPVFVAPFLLWKLREGQWRIVLLYSAAYVSFIAWWALYPMLVSPLVSAGVGHASHDNFLTEGVIARLMKHDPRSISLMVLNLLRFVSWQNLALLPLLVAGVPVATRERGLARALLVGIVFWILFLGVVMAEQGRAYGYRYLNGYEGSFALLAGFGYRELEQRIGRQADGIVAALSGLTVVAAIPMLFTATSQSLRPHLAMQRLISGQHAPAVLIDNTVAATTDGRFADNADDHVRNLPNLSNRPLRFGADNLDAGQLIALCRRMPVTLITRRDMHRVGFILNEPERSPKFEALVAAARADAPDCFHGASLPPAFNAD